RRVRVHRVLIVVLREQEHAGLPPQGHGVRQVQRRLGGGGQAHLLGELEGLFGVVAAQQRQRGVVEIRRVLGLPLQEPGRRRQRHARAFETVVDRRREDVAMRVALVVPRGREGRAAQRAQILQRVVAVAGALTAQDEPRLPVRRRREQQL